MTAFLDDVMVDRITAEAREVHFGRTMLTILAALFFSLGWITARVFTYTWLVLAWSATAIKVGWQEGRKAGG